MLYCLSDLRKVFDHKTILDISSLELEQGKITALLGPNGAGKTTLLHILGFLESPTSGQVLYKSEKVRYLETNLQRLRKEVVVVDQHPILFTTTVYRNVDFGLKIRGISKKKRDYIIDDVLELVGMREFIHAPAHLLSGGETQRVALARALAISPEVFLCDEPTSSVDTENQDIVINALRQANEEKKITVLFTTHDRIQASALAHSTLVLDHGRLVSTGYENIFSAQFFPEDPQYVRCKIQNTLELILPEGKRVYKPGKARIFIDPGGIDLIDAMKDKTSSDIHSGRIVQLAEENGDVRIVVDSGIRITIIVSKEKYRDIRPEIGKTVDFIIKPEAVSLF